MHSHSLELQWACLRLKSCSSWELPSVAFSHFSSDFSCQQIFQSVFYSHLLNTCGGWLASQQIVSSSCTMHTWMSHTHTGQETPPHHRACCKRHPWRTPQELSSISEMWSALCPSFLASKWIFLILYFSHDDRQPYGKLPDWNTDELLPFPSLYSNPVLWHLFSLSARCVHCHRVSWTGSASKQTSTSLQMSLYSGHLSARLQQWWERSKSWVSSLFFSQIILSGRLYQRPPESTAPFNVGKSLFPLPCLLSVSLIKQLYILMIPWALQCLPLAVLPVGFHSVRYADIDGLCFCASSTGDEQGVGRCLTQVTGDKAVLPSGVTQRRWTGMSGWLADVGNDGDAVHGFFVVTNFQDFKVDLDVGVANPSPYPHLHAHAADVHICSLASRRCVVCTGFVANRLGAIHFHL